MILKKLFFSLILCFFSSAWGTPSYALWDIDRGEILEEEGSETIRSIASITKLMNALVTLQSGLSLDEKLTVVGKESSVHIRRGMILSRGDLLYLTLVCSDNLAARTLAENGGRSYQEYIDEMNRIAQSLEMRDTWYSDSTGLNSENRSSIGDIKKLILETEKWPIFQKVATTVALKIDGLKIATKRGYKSVSVIGHNTNLYAGRLDLIAAKTGFTNSAGRCLTMYFWKNGVRYVLVVLGAKDSVQRKLLVDRLLTRVNKDV